LLDNDATILNSFEDTDFITKIPRFLAKNISSQGFKQPTPIQKHSLPLSLDNIDLLCCSQTGSGKTMSYLIPLIAALCKPYEQLVSMRSLRMMKVTPDSSVSKAASSSMDSSEETGSSIQSSNDSHETISIFDRISENSEYSINENITRMSIDARGILPFGLIVVPTRELAIQIWMETRKLIAGSNIRSVCVYGGADTVKKQLKDMSSGCDVLIGTPGRLEDFIDRHIISIEEVRFVVIDEVDRMFDSLGFEKQIKKLMNSLIQKKYRQCLCFSATFSDSVKIMASEFLHNHVLISVGNQGKSIVSTVRQRLVLACASLENKFSLLLECITDTPGRTLVFVREKKVCSWVTLLLNQYGIQAGEIHGDKTQDERELSLSNFRSGIVMVLVATDVAARGIDVVDITHVINFDMPITPRLADLFFSGADYLAAAMAVITAEKRLPVGAWSVEIPYEPVDMQSLNELAVSWGVEKYVEELLQAALG
jgi:ATP-dependent RNA helicase DDX3X